MAPNADQSLGAGFVVPLNRLIGREAELSQAESLLVESERRLITLTGPGGVGKTHLAIQLALDARADFPDGAAFVSLAPVQDGELLLPAIANVLGVSEGDQPLMARLEERLRGRRFLLVLDNFEQLLDAAPIVSRLLGRCPGVTALVTSRVALRLRGEQVVAVPPLSPPADAMPGQLVNHWENPAVLLFVDRARAAGGTIAESDDEARVIAAICRRLDGLPLAIELAAAMAPVLTPKRLLTRLEQALPMLTHGPRDAPARQRTMRDAIAWSYDLLEPAHRALFRRLSVFSGGFSLAAAEHLTHGWQPEDGYRYAGGRDFYNVPWWMPAGKESPAAVGQWDPLPLAPIEIDPAQGIWVLVSQNLMRHVSAVGEEPRFELLETIREFGLEQLAASGESWAARHAHVVWFLSLAEAAGLGLWGPDRRTWAAMLEADISNVRAALGWLAMQEEPANQLSLRLAEALWPYWHMYGHATEGRRWLERALARERGTPLARTQAMIVLGMLAWVQGDDDRATEVLHDALPILRSHGVESALARCLFCLALVAWRRNDYRQMVALAQEALPLFQHVDDQTGAGVCLAVLALVARGSGDYQHAAALLRQAEDAFAVADFRWGIATARYYAGEVAREEGDAARGEQLVQEALSLYQEWGDPWGMGACIVALGSIAAERQQLLRGARLFGAGFALCDAVGAFLPPTELVRYRAVAAAVHEELGSVAYDEAVAGGTALPVNELVAYALGEREEDAESIKTPTTTVAEAASKVTFTPRQLEVIRQLAGGHSVKEIASAWGWGASNIYGHIHKACLRAGVNTMAELVAFGVRNGYVQ